MTTLLDQSQIHLAVQALREGELVAFPTETVYGLGADAMNPQAVSKIFEVKQRPQDNPLIVHLADPDQLSQYARISSPLEQILIQKLTPGPLTILLGNISIPDVVTAGHHSVGIRFPDHPLALALLSSFWWPICAPSANRSGRPSPTTAQMVLDDIDGRIPYILDGGSCLWGIESTVVKVINDEIVIYRPGLVTLEDLTDLWDGQVIVRYTTVDTGESPGVRYRHYAPMCEVKLLPDDVSSFADDSPSVGVLVMHELVADPRFAQTRVYDRWQSLAECAQRLYQSYVQTDRDSVKTLYVQQLPEYGLGTAIMNRVRKSVMR